MTQLLLLGLATVAVGLSARVTERSWIAPAALFGLLWGAYLTAVSAYVVDPAPMVAGAL
ncbi:MAG TPA: hypothetical protein VFM14_06675 [Gemmatimonadales bacterium]|nr:hypothetical protein [Gemmatimonadales bacterium]